MTNPTFVNPIVAFERAIAVDQLSSTRDCAPGRYASEWMYMHTSDGEHAFKHIRTRKYIRVPA